MSYILSVTEPYPPNVIFWLFRNMRAYKHKTERPKVPVHVRKRAVKVHLIDKLRLKVLSLQFSIPVRTLTRYSQIAREKNECWRHPSNIRRNWRTLKSLTGM